MGNRFDGKTAIVTGGASGIGFGIAEGLAAGGATVVLADRDAAGGAAAAERLSRAGHVACFQELDVCRAAECRRMVEGAVDRWGKVDILVNSAGIGRGGPVTEIAEETWDLVLDTNLKGTFLCCQAVVPAMAQGGGGSILNIASLAAMRAAPGFGAYGASKAGVVHFTGILCLEVAPVRIRVNALCPVWVDTPMVQGYLAATGDPVRARKEMERSIPLGRLGSVADVTAAALFLLSDEAAFLTGVALPVDGGARWA